MDKDTFKKSDTEQYTMFNTGDFEYVNPVFQFATFYKESALELDLSILRLKKIEPSYKSVQLLKIKNQDTWQKKFQDAINYDLPNELYQVLNSSKKGEQIKLLKDLTLTSDMYFAFMLQAWDTYRFKMSRYVGSYKPKELQGKIYPNYIFRDSKEDYNYHGYTNLSKAQLKVAIDNRRHTVADFFDNGDIWHCFFRTLHGIKGIEAPHINEPHMHYVSSAWGYDRKFVVSQLKSYRHSLKSLHINFEKDDSKNEDEI